MPMQSNTDKQIENARELMDRAAELSVEDQYLLLMMAKAMRFTRDSILLNQAHTSQRNHSA